MKVTGIVVEYNPFHNGHKYHIDKARELTDPDVLVAVCSGNYNQRGDISIIDKFQKTEAALNNGVDLVLELPYIFTLQNAYVFGKNAIDILNKCLVDTIVFGSETNNIDELKKYAELEVDVTRLKELMHDGNSYPKAYGLLSSCLYPNDILAVTYLKAIKDTDIKPVSIQRTNDYHDENLDIISSATAIRKAVKENKDISKATPITIEEPLFNEMLYPYIRNILFASSRKDLSDIFMMDEGIEGMLKENAIKYDTYDEFLDKSVSRRYTRSRIQRILMHMINQIKKEDVKNLPECDYVRVLGFNEKGRNLLKSLKDSDTKFVTQFKNIPEAYKDIEYKSSLVYSSLMKNQKEYMKKELKGPIIK
ncbi:MAG: nucleotidyltransferase [Erysipelotrichaceae bacterium]|nr:nucleotidyltransferase [Erysipelotrichaceae bacterium]